MPESCTLLVNGHPITAPANQSVLIALMNAGYDIVRRSVSGELRGPLCGMGVCFECRVSIDGFDHVKACQTVCCEGMRVTIPERHDEH